MTQETGSTGGGGERVSFFDFAAALVQWRKMIAMNFLIVTGLAVIISLLLPKWYKASASILPPKDQNPLNLFGLQSTALRSLPISPRLGGLTQNFGAYNYLAILKSRTVMEAVVRKFNLIAEYEVSDSSIEKAIKLLEENVAFDIQEENYITIDVFDRDPVRAADMANCFIDQLNAVSIKLGTQEARSNRDFIGKRLETGKSDLRIAEDTLRRYQERHGIMLSTDQNSSSISAIAELYAMKAKEEIELAILQRNVTPDNESLQQLKIQLSELDKKLSGIPQLGIESFRLYRDVAVHQKILEYLTPLYEQAKIDEQKDIPVILVLDKAIPPEKRFKPKRTVIVASAAGISLFFSLMVILAKLYIDTLRRKRAGEYDKLLRIVSDVKGGLRIFRGRK